MTYRMVSEDYQRAAWELRDVPQGYNDYAAALNKMLKPLMDRAGLGCTIKVLRDSDLPAPGVCVTETASIYLAASLFDGIPVSEVGTDDFFRKHPRVAWVVIHEILHRLLSSKDWRKWLKKMGDQRVAKVATQMEEPRIECVGIKRYGPTAGREAGRHATPDQGMLTELMVATAPATVDELIARNAAKIDDVEQRGLLSSLMILIWGRVLGGSADPRTPNVKKGLELIDNHTTPEFRGQAQIILSYAVNTSIEGVQRKAEQWVELMDTWEEPERDEEDEPEEPGGEGDEPCPDGDPGNEPGDDDETPEPDDEGDEPGPGGLDGDESEESDDDPEDGEGGSPGPEGDESDDDDSEGDEPGEANDADPQPGDKPGEEGDEEDGDEPDSVSKGGSDDPASDDIRDYLEELRKQVQEDEFTELSDEAEELLQQAFDLTMNDRKTLRDRRHASRKTATTGWRNRR